MNNSSLRIFSAITLFFMTMISFAQTDCTANTAAFDFFSGCGAASPITGDYHITVSNGDQLVINGDLTITGTLTIKLVGGSSSVLLESPFTLSAAGLVFDGSATGKVLTIQGPSGALDVSGTLDFGGNTIEIDGDGSITAGDITGGDNVTCEGDADCPDISADTCTDPSGICTEANTIVPVKLISFDVKLVKSNVELRWSTASELNNDFFTIERSSDGLDYHILSTIQGAGTTNEELFYFLLDEAPLKGTSYYRLKQTDFDGEFEYFDARSVSLTGVYGNEISTYPNPVSDFLQIGDFGGKVEDIRLLNIHGKDVTSRTSITANTNSISMDLGELESGIYFLKTSQGSKKIVKQ